MTHPLGVDRAQFPVLNNGIYLNHAGVSPIPKAAADLIRLYADEVEQEGATAFAQWTPRLHKARKQAARLLNAPISEVAFVKSTTDGLNKIALGLEWNDGDVIVIEENTFPANWHPWKGAETLGAKTWVWPERDYGYRLEDLEARLKQGGVRLVASASASFSTGFRHDLKSLSDLCKRYGALLCLDAIQTLGVYPLDVQKIPVDFISADSHKWLLGPEGAGFLYVRKDRLDLFSDRVVGWLGRQNFPQYHRLDLPPDPTARRFEEGSPNIVGFTAMGASLELINDTGVDRIGPHNRQLCEVLEEGFLSLGWNVISPRDSHASSIVCAEKDGADPAKVSAELWERHRIASAARRGFLRFSPHFYETEADMEKVVAALRGVS